MKNVARVLALVPLAVLAAALLASGPETGAAPDPTVRTVRIQCVQGWGGSAVGVYGGVSFGVSCNNGRGQARLTGTSGTTYSMRMGVESSSVAIDCGFSGDAAQVQETCGPVEISIR